MNFMAVCTGCELVTAVLPNSYKVTFSNSEVTPPNIEMVLDRPLEVGQWYHIEITWVGSVEEEQGNA
jgi:hypothetical protein